ncbi:Secretory carrier-associated membrane protein 1-like 1 [Homarus americanus]|uniref:Secretory carrier-associated membrane protein n=1 Tax=Homarus americanus TaxID=6706 RepID=A0A8J5J963_HOMAM|nr:Secretory carrier-associated membrane protein 1-like 1 [Homarus americanus]
MGSKVSSEDRGGRQQESESIVRHTHQQYRTTSGLNGKKQVCVIQETKIGQKNEGECMYHEERQTWRTTHTQGGNTSTDTTSVKRDLRISFNRKDLSAPLAITVESITRQDNWPPLPSSFPVGPCFYQDINVDIPLEFQKIVRMLYYLWMFHALMLLLNILGGLGIFIMMNEGSTFGLAILYFFLFTPFSYVCWFRPVYKAFRNDSSFNFMVFFFVFSFQLIVSIINAIGIPRMGSCGFILGLSTLGQDNAPSNYIVGIIVFMIALGFAAVAAIDAILLIKWHPTGVNMRKYRRLAAEGSRCCGTVGGRWLGVPIGGRFCSPHPVTKQFSCALLTILNYYGDSGWVSVSRSFSLSHIGLGVFMILVALAASFQSVAMAYALLRVHRIYRSTGASFAKAQVEFSQGVMRNEHVQNVTANAAEAAVRNQFGSTAAGGNSSSPRF